VSYARRQKTNDQMKAEDPKAAVAEFDKALSLAEKSGNFAAAEYTLRGLANYVKSADGKTLGYDTAIQWATQRFPTDTDSRWKLLAAALYRAKGDFGTARGLIAELMRTLNSAPNPQDPREMARKAAVLRLAADVYQNDPASPDLVAAKGAYEQLLLVRPEDVICMNNLAHLLAEHLQPTDPQTAKKYSARAYDLARLHWPEYQEVKDTHGWVLTLCGGHDSQEGLTLLKQVVEHKPDFAEAWYHLGEAYMRLDKPDAKAAEQQFQKALAAIKKRKEANEKNATADVYLQELEKKVSQSLVRAREKLAVGA
jgi:tetratricopeptide (TPR) repeat protein